MFWLCFWLFVSVSILTVQHLEIYSLQLWYSTLYSAAMINPMDFHSGVNVLVEVGRAIYCKTTKQCKFLHGAYHETYAMGHIAPFTLRILLYGDDNLGFTENKRIITEKLRFINDSKRFAWLPSIFLCWFSDCVCSPFIVNIPFLIFLLMSICISSLLVWISIKSV